MLQYITGSKIFSSAPQAPQDPQIYWNGQEELGDHDYQDNQGDQNNQEDQYNQDNKIGNHVNQGYHCHQSNIK